MILESPIVRPFHADQFRGENGEPHILVDDYRFRIRERVVDLAAYLVGGGE
jgi:hypothetical protein